MFCQKHVSLICSYVSFVVCSLWVDTDILEVARTVVSENHGKGKQDRACLFIDSRNYKMVKFRDQDAE